MFDALFLVPIICTIAQSVKDSFTKPIPAENWANKELYHRDIMDGVSIEQRLKNLKNGKYKLCEKQSECDLLQKECNKEVRVKTEFEKRYGL